jgi:hypothetical protein
MVENRNAGILARIASPHVRLLAWLGPAIATGVFYVVQGLVVGLRYTRVFGLVMTGQLFLGIGAMIVVYLLLYHSPFFRVLFTWVNLGAAIASAVAMVMVSFQGFRLLLAVATWGFVAGIWWHRGDFRAILERIPLREIPRWLRARFTRREQTRIAGAMIVVGLLAVHGTFLLEAPSWNLQEREFAISTQQAQATDIVFYYACGTPTEYSAHHDVIDAAKLTTRRCRSPGT